MNKYYLHPDHINSVIHTKTDDGTEIIVTAATFDDYFAEMLLKRGAGHLVKINPVYLESEHASEKKTFHQISEGVISLTSKPDEIDLNEQPKTVNEQESKPKRGRPSRVKA